MSTENRRFKLRHYFAEILKEHEDTCEAWYAELRSRGASDSDIEYLDKSKMAIFSAIAEILSKFQDDPDALHVINSLGAMCRLLDQRAVGHGEQSLLRRLDEENQLDKLL